MLGKRGVRGSSTSVALKGFEMGQTESHAAYTAATAKHSRAAKTDQPCFLLQLRLLEGKIRFAFCSASHTESLSSPAGQKAEPSHGACTCVLAELRETPRVVILLSQLALIAHAGVEALHPHHRDVSLPWQLSPLPCLWWRKSCFQMMAEILGICPLLNQAQDP